MEADPNAPKTEAEAAAALDEADAAALGESGAVEAEAEAPRPWTSPELSGEVDPPAFEQQPMPAEDAGE